MKTYRFYYRRPEKGDEMIGVLPERRKNPARITWESIMGWRKIFERTLDTEQIFFVEMTIGGNDTDRHKYLHI
jgi:hypothetical protein